MKVLYACFSFSFATVEEIRLGYGLMFDLYGVALVLFFISVAGFCMLVYTTSF